VGTFMRLDMTEEANELIGLAAKMNGGDFERANAWFYETPLAELGGGRAADYVANGRADVVRRYLLNLEAGSTG